MITPRPRLLFALGLFSLAPFLAAGPFEDAVALFDAKKAPEALPHFEAITKTDPRNTRAWLYLARCHLSVQKPDEALIAYEKAAALAPKDAEVLAEYGGACLNRAGQLGMSFRAMGLARKGRDHLEKAVALAPDKIEPRVWLADYYRMAPGIAGGSTEKAYEQATEVRKLDLRRGTVLMASVQLSDKKPDEAYRTLTAYLATAPDTYSVLFALGRITTDAGKHLDEGEKAFRRCLELTPAANEAPHANVHFRLGQLLEKAGRVDEAKVAYRAALGLQPGFTRAADALKRLSP